MELFCVVLMAAIQNFTFLQNEKKNSQYMAQVYLTNQILLKSVHL